MPIDNGVFLFLATSCCCLAPSFALYISVLANISDLFCIKLSLSKLSWSMLFSFHIGQMSLGESSHLGPYDHRPLFLISFVSSPLLAKSAGFSKEAM